MTTVALRLLLAILNTYITQTMSQAFLQVMLTHSFNTGLANGPDCTRIEGLLLPISVKLHSLLSCSSPLITHTWNPLLPRQLLLQPESFLSEAWSSISVQSIVVMALLGAPLLRWCVSSCIISPLPAAFSLLGGPR